MLAFEITRFNRDYNSHEEDDPTYTKKIISSSLEVLKFLETEIIEGSTVVVIVWDENKFLASFTYGA
jgi:hypothetical protein